MLMTLALCDSSFVLLIKKHIENPCRINRYQISFVAILRKIMENKEHQYNLDFILVENEYFTNLKEKKNSQYDNVSDKKDG